MNYSFICLSGCSAGWNVRVEKIIGERQAYSQIAFGKLYAKLRYADKYIVNMMKVYIERNNLLLEWYRTKCWLYSRLLLQSDGFNSITPADWAPKSSPAMLTYSLDGSRCACHAYQHVSNTNQFDHCHFWTVIGDSNSLLFNLFLTV